ncbi:MAG: hypothetical protein ACR2QO_25330, partial [Acidimicrobiales bacterium]
WSSVTRTTSGDDGTTPISTGSSYFDGCDFDQVAAGEEYVTGRSDIASVNVDNSVFPEDQWVIFCPDRIGQGPLGFDAYTFYPVGDPPPVPVIDAMIADAYSRTPVVAFNPISSPDGDDDIPLVTQMTTFLWVDEVAWATPVSAEASIPGFTVRTTAMPAIAEFQGGDDSATCDGDQMEPYVFGIGGDDAQPSECSIVFTRSTAVIDQEIALDVTWAVDYSCSIPVCGGPLPDIIISSVRPVTVAEIQAVESGS